jgi:hypothetical protein
MVFENICNGEKMEIQEAIQLVKQRYETDIQRINDEKSVIEKFGSIFNPSNLDNLTADDFKSFLLIKNNKHWEGIHRQGNMITSDMKKLQSVLKLLLDESKPIKERINKIMPKNKPALIKGLGRAVLTPILLVVYPEKYAVYNSVAEAGMKGFGVFPDLKNKSFAEKYITINDIVNKLAKQNGLSLWQIDEVWWQGTTGALPLDESSRSMECENGFPTELESQLEDIVISSWDNLPEFKDLEILQDDGEYIGQQYDTKEVGRIDLLCRNKKTKNYVVIELKKGRESDKVVGQILRYMGWVKTNLVKNGEKVRGIIITFEGDPDLKLKYSLELIKDLIQLKFYKINITIS